MATFSKKMGGKEVGHASVYAKPHTMTGKAVSASENPGKMPDRSELGNLRPSVGAVHKGAQPSAKTSGIKMRGAGAATKGVMSRGPMA
jgi:hypothetical protein